MRGTNNAVGVGPTPMAQDRREVALVEPCGRPAVGTGKSHLLEPLGNVPPRDRRACRARRCAALGGVACAASFTREEPDVATLARPPSRGTGQLLGDVPPFEADSLTHQSGFTLAEGGAVARRAALAGTRLREELLWAGPVPGEEELATNVIAA
jgi:hypothetical protein